MQWDCSAAFRLLNTDPVRLSNDLKTNAPTPASKRSDREIVESCCGIIKHRHSGLAAMANALKSSVSSVKIDQHSPGGKRLQTAVQEKLKEYMGPEYSDEVTSGIGSRGDPCETSAANAH